MIDFEKTKEKFGGIPKNVKKGKVVVRCEDCSELSDVKLSSLLHQARRHRLNGRACIYKCFGCGIKRPDAMDRANKSRERQLAAGFISGLEVAAGNRFDHLGIKYSRQFPIDMYVWDFFLPEHDLLVDVNGEYWHSRPENVSKDRAKFTYAERYYPQYRRLIIEEKNFLNPLMVDRIILGEIGQLPDPVLYDFELSDLSISRLPAPKQKVRAPYVDFLNSFHYAQCGRMGKAIYGAYLGDILIAVAKFNSVVRKEIASSRDLLVSQVLELDRFCIHPSYQKKNLASWFISRCVKQVFLDFPGVVELASFADESFGHAGTIYKAANWTFLGKTRPSYHYMDGSGIPINKKRVYDIASKLLMKEAEYVQKHGLLRFVEKPKSKFVFERSDRF